MKITVSQLRTIIREAVKRAMTDEEAVVPGHPPYGDYPTVSDKREAQHLGDGIWAGGYLDEEDLDEDELEESSSSPSSVAATAGAKVAGLNVAGAGRQAVTTAKNSSSLMKVAAASSALLEDDDLDEEDDLGEASSVRQDKPKPYQKVVKDALPITQSLLKDYK